MTSSERQLEEELIAKLCDLKYEFRTHIRNRATLEKNFREKFQSLNHVKLTEAEFQRLLDEIVTPDVFTAAHTLSSTSPTGAKTPSRSSASSASIPTTATTVTTSSCSSAACRSRRSS